MARNNIKARYEGFNAALEEFDVELADYKQMSQFTRAEAEGIASDLLTTYDDLAVIFTHMDEPTLGTVKAVQNADKGDSVIVCGFDGTPETVTSIENGELLAGRHFSNLHLWENMQFRLHSRSLMERIRKRKSMFLHFW